MATSPTGRQHPPLPAPPQQQAERRMTPEEVMQPTKAQKTSKDTTIRSTEETTKEPPPLRQRINAVTLSNGTSITSYTNDDTTEDQPIILDNEGYDEAQLLEGMKHESGQMKLHDVYDEVATSTVDDNVLREAIPTKWVHRKKGTGVRSRIVAKRYTEKIEDEDSVYASTPMFTTLRTLLALQMSRPNWVARLGGISTRTHCKRQRRQTTRCLPLATKRAVSTTGQTMAAKESHVWTTQLTQSLAKLPG